MGQLGRCLEFEFTRGTNPRPHPKKEDEENSAFLELLGAQEEDGTPKGHAGARTQAIRLSSPEDDWGVQTGH